MGYTIFYTQVGAAPTETEWAQITKAAEAVVEKYKDILCADFEDPESAPIVDENMIFFNGKGDDGHETFMLHRGQDGFDFCKTARKPYTAAVKEILEEVNYIVPGWLRLSDDGDWRP